MADDEIIGRASATERESNTADEFSFWLRPGEQVNPFDIVDSEHLTGSHSYGLVTDIRHSTDSPTHLTNYIANDFGELTEEPNTPRQGANVARVSIMSNTDDVYMPVQTEALVRFADEEGIHRGLGIEIMAEKEEQLGRPVRVPAGLIQMSNGSSAVAHLDIDYLIGPESAHVNVSGISGLATKTSYIMFLLQSLMQVLERGSREHGSAEDVAVVLVNVKHNDLLGVDEKADEGRYPDSDLEMWERMGLIAKPFSDVEYLLPAGEHTVRVPDQPNSYPPLPNVTRSKIYAYSLRDTYTRLPNLLADVPDEYGTMDAIVGAIQDGLDQAARGKGDWKDVWTWQDLVFKSPLRDWIDGNAQPPGAVPPRSIGRFIRYLNRLVRDRNSGLLVQKPHDRWTTIENEISQIKGGKTYVVDIAKLQDHEQALVFGDVVRTVYDVMATSAEEELDLTGLDDAHGRRAPKRVILFVDELNKFAPKGRKDSPLLEDLVEIAERGRSIGIVLLSAQQFSSAVHDRVIGNSATRVYGRTAPTELSQSAMRGMNESVRSHLARLGKGELVLTHPMYRQPVRIRFPRPAYRQPG